MVVPGIYVGAAAGLASSSVLHGRRCVSSVLRRLACGRSIASVSSCSPPSVRSFASGRDPEGGMYGEGGVDPTEGRARWHKLDVSKYKLTPKPILGALNSKEYDERHGRWWHTRKEEDRPKLYTSIGKHARSKKLKRTIVRWLYNSPNFKNLRRDPYRKRWPDNHNICIRFFAEFALKEFEKRPLLETAHMLPLYGVGCKFWRAPTASTPETKGQYFVADSADFRQRPIRGMLKGRQFLHGRLIRSNIAAIAKKLGSWRHEFPEGGHPAVYRPPFPALLPAPAAAES